MTKAYKEAKEYFNLPKGWVLHHKDVNLRHTDPIRYNEWRIEDLEPMTKSDHRRLHNNIWNPMEEEENRQKISKAMEKYKDIPRGTLHNMSDEDWHNMQSKAVSNRNKTMWKDPEYREYMNEKMHASQRTPIKCITTGVEYKSIRDANRDTGLSRHFINKSANNHTVENGLQFEWIGEITT